MLYKNVIKSSINQTTIEETMFKGKLVIFNSVMILVTLACYPRERVNVARLYNQLVL